MHGIEELLNLGLPVLIIRGQKVINLVDYRFELTVGVPYLLGELSLIVLEEHLLMPVPNVVTALRTLQAVLTQHHPFTSAIHHILPIMSLAPTLGELGLDLS